MNSNCKSLLDSFLNSMNSWEVFYAQKMFEAAEAEDFENMRAIKAEAKRHLNEIFEKHCLEGKGDRRRLISVSMKDPATYDLNRDHLSLIENTDRKAVFEYQQTTGLNSKIKFELTLSNGGEWKINTALFFDEIHEKWIRWSL